MQPIATRRISQLIVGWSFANSNCRVMKLTILLLLTTFLQVNARSWGQEKVTLNLKNASLEKVFMEIRKQTSFDFLYRDELVQNLPKITIVVKNATIEEVLSMCFEGLPITYSVEGNNIVIKEKRDSVAGTAGTKEAPPIDVRGKVVNESGNPVANVTVAVKGTSITTLTDSDGRFSLSTVDYDAVLTFTHVGMEPFELKVSGQSELLIRLKTKVSELDGVTVTVSTGYQDIPKERATGSFVKVDNEMFNQQVGTNVLDRLDGVTTGFQTITGKSDTKRTLNIAVRGLSTINGNLDPLVVLDNFIYEGDINNINPNDVESVTILKDAAAASIWGAKAANGVIVITTKKGKFNQKLSVEFNSNFIIKEKPDLYYQPTISVSDYLAVEEFIFNKGYFNNQISNTSSRPALTPAVEIFLKRRNGEISAEDSAMLIDQLKSYDLREQLNEYVYRKAVTQQYSINLRGGSNNLAWIIAGTLDKSTGSMQNEFDKINLRFNNTYKPLKQIELSLGTYYTNSKDISGMNPVLTVNNRYVPYLRIADENGNPLPLYTYRSGYIDTVGAGHLLDWKYYPLEEHKYYNSTTNLQELIANVGMGVQIMKGLSLKVNYQYQKQWDEKRILADVRSYAARDLINNYSQVNYNTGNVTYIVPMGSILTLNNSNLSSQNFRSQLNYNMTWGDHGVAGIVGFETREVKSDGNRVIYYGYIEDPLSFTSVDYVNRYRVFIPGSQRTIPNVPAILATTVNRFVSTYVNASYSYKSRYIFSASFRKDASNVFGLNTNDKWNPLWSLGVSWDVSKEKFYNIQWLSLLKVRTTYGYSGNVDVSRSALPVAFYSTNTITNFPYGRIGTLNNPSLRWEKNGQLNFAIDFATKKQILSGNIEYYRKKGTDLYGATPYDYTAWGSTDVLTKNVAGMEGSGIEIGLTSRNVVGNFNWTSKFYFNYLENKTTVYYEESAQDVSGLITGGTAIKPIIGKPLYAIAAYKWAGLTATGDPAGYFEKQISTDYSKIIAQDGKKGFEEGSFTYIGTAIPTYFGSLINEFEWKGLSVAVNIAYRLGYYFRRPVFTSSELINGGNGHKDYEKRWQQPGDELITNVPAFVYTNYPQFIYRDDFYRYSEINVLKADNIRLQYINASYSLERKNRRLPFQRLTIYGNISNVGIIWRANKEGLDPDSPSSPPSPRTVAVGIRGSF
jgi:TonB-linked outer membrane protein, SusC/RagA family